MLTRIFSVTDDLTHRQLVTLLSWLVVSGLVRVADIKGWRRKNNLPVNRED